MARARWVWILGIGLMLAPVSTQARELELGLEQRIGGDSNILRQSEDAIDDGFYEIAPRLTLREDRRDEINYLVRYRPLYRTFFETRGLDGWDHTQAARLNWQITPVDSLSFDQSYVSTRARRLDFVEATPTEVIVEPSDRDRSKRAEASLSLGHVFTPRVSGRAGLQFEDYDFESSNLVDSRAYGGSLGASYQLSERTTVGISGLARYRQSRGVGNQLSSDNYTLNVSGSISRQLSPTLDLSFQIGPSVIYTDPDPVDSSASSGLEPDSNVSFFAAASLEKRWLHGSAEASYTRSESGGAGSTSSQILDAVDLDVRYWPARRWDFRLYGRWSRREVVSSFGSVVGEIVNEQNVTIYQAVASARYALTDRIALEGRLDYRSTVRDAESSVSSDDSRSTDVYSGFLSVNYTFEPFVF